MLRGRYIWSIILIFILNFVWLSTQGYSLVAQHTQNPFDLPQRLEILEKEKELSQETQKDSTATVSPSEDSNPFNVSHVPIKRVRPNTNNEVKLGSNLGSYFVFWISIISLRQGPPACRGRRRRGRRGRGAGPSPRSPSGTHRDA